MADKMRAERLPLCIAALLSRCGSRFIPLLTLSCLLVVIWLTFWNVSDKTIFFADDQATDLIIAKLLSGGSTVLLGPPASTGGRHLGPVYYWFVTSAYALAKGDAASTVVIMSVLKLSVLVCLGSLLALLLKRSLRLAFILGFLAAIASPAYIESLRTAWHSNFLAVASIAAFTATLLLIRYGTCLISLWLAGLSFLATAHLSSAPVVAGLLAAGCISLLLKRGNCAPPPFPTYLLRAIQVSSTAIIFILWAPLLVHELYYQSNVRTLFSVQRPAPSRSAGLRAAAGEGLLFFRLHIPVIPLWSLTLAWGLSGAAVLLSWIKEDFKTNSLVLVALLTPVVITVCSLAVLHTPIYNHYYNSSLAVPLILSGLMFAESVRLAVSESQWVSKAAGVIFILLTTLGYAFSIRASLNLLNSPRHPPFHTLGHAREVTLLLSKDAAKQEAAGFEIIPRMAAKRSHNSYYYALGRPDLAGLHYKEFFHEIPEFQKPAEEYAVAYSILCPAPFYASREAIFKQIRCRWEGETQIRTDECKSCSNCIIHRWKAAAGDRCRTEMP